MLESEKTSSEHCCQTSVIQIGIGRMTQPNQKGEQKHMKKTPKRKTSVYLDKENLETIKGFKEKYNLSVNRTINMCLTKYLPEMLVWI